MSTPTIFNAIEELQALEDKAAQGKEIRSEDTFLVRAALKAEGWDISLCEEAISRGYKRSRGEEVAEPPWYTVDDDMSEAPEIPGLEATEEEPGQPGRLFNLLGDMGGEEPEEQEEVREEEPKDPELAKLLDYNFWDCPACGAVNRKEEAFCPNCAFLKARHDEALKKYHELKGKKMHTAPTTKEDLKSKFAAHLADSRKRVTVDSDVGWLCEECNSVWSLEQQKCPNRCKPAEPPTVEHRGWGDEPTIIKSTLGDAQRIVLEEAEDAGDPLAADPNLLLAYDSEVLRKYMAKHLGHEVMHEDTEKKSAIADKIKQTLGVDHLPGEPIKCTICGIDDNDKCKCCYECNSKECICCDMCFTHPCVCDETEVCPLCNARFEIGEACPSGCDADHAALLNLYEEVKESTELNFIDKAKYMALLKEKIRLIEDAEENEYGPLDEPDEG